MKKYSIFVSSNQIGKTYVMNLTQSSLKAAVVLGTIMFFLVASILIDYLELLSSRVEFVKVKEEHSQLLTNLQFVENELHSLESQLTKVDKLTEKIQVIQEYYSQGPISTMATPTEYFTVDYVATGEKARVNTSSLLQSYKHPSAWVENRNRLLSRPLIYKKVEDQKPLSEKMTERIEIAGQNTQALERKVMQLWENLSERENFIRATPSVRPTRGWFSSRFGVRADPFTGAPTMHSGLDLAAPRGTPIIATADGVVTFAGYQSGYGNIVTIDHGYGIQTRYAHNYRVLVSSGQSVRRYDVIAEVGSTGRSTGAHCHYEVRIRGVAVDPINYILDF